MVDNDPEFEKVPSPELDQVPVFAPPVIVPVKDTVAFGTKQICWSNPALTTTAGSTVITLESVTELQGPVGFAEVRVKVIVPPILGVNVVCRLFAFPKVPPFDGLTDQVPVLAPPLIVPLIGMVVPAQIVVSFPALTTGFTKNVTVKESFTALHGPTGLMDVSVSVTLEFAIS
jgi:hypothetical protein